MQPRLFALVLAGLFFTLLAGCADPDGAPVAAADTVEPDPVVAESSPGRFRVSGLVVEDASHGPQLCGPRVLLLAPPRCGGTDIVGWSWDGLAHSTDGAIRHGSLELVGTYDGERFTLTEPPGPPRPEEPTPARDYTRACPPPADGWQVVDDATATRSALQKAIYLVSAAPSGAGFWIDQNGGENDPKKLVLNVRFTGDLPGHEARLRTVWGGALCVSAADRTTAELTRVQDEVGASGSVLETSIDTVASQVRATVWIVTDALREELAARYGPGTVVLTGYLVPA